MEMATLQLYKNPYRYPKYTETLTRYGSSMECTPVGINLHGGTLRVAGSMTDFMSCNYLSLARDGQTLWAWIDDVKYFNDNAFEISYTVDAWRTYKGKITLGTQFIKRSPAVTNLRDPLLGSTQPWQDISSTDYTIGNAAYRVAVVQVRGTGGQTASNSPVQPTPYQLYLVEYSVNNWQQTQALVDLMSALPANGQTENIVTIYSIPWIDTSSLPSAPLIIQVPNSTDTTVNGFKAIDSTTDVSNLLYNETPINVVGGTQLQRVPHSVQVVIPEAGILTVPDEILMKPNLKLRQDIDLFSGACNYMLTTGSTATGDYSFYNQSVRGSSVSSIPILSNPEDTYISQNQNGLTTSLIGDVASLAIGAATVLNPELAAARMAAGASSMDFATKMWGASVVAQGGSSILGNFAQRADHGTQYSNPPAFLGTAMAANFAGRFWVTVTQLHTTNGTTVNDRYGYPYNLLDSLTFPSAGYIETQNCAVESDGSVPRWAIEEINTLFDNGILVK